MSKILTEDELGSSERERFSSHRGTFKQGKCASNAVLDLIDMEMHIGMMDQGTEDPDGSTDLPALLEYARRKGYEKGLISYLKRIRGWTDEDLAPAYELMGTVTQFPDLEQEDPS